MSDRRSFRVRAIGLRVAASIAALLLAVGLTIRLSVSLSGESPTAREKIIATDGGELVVSTDVTGRPLFDDALLVPGEDVSRCVRVDTRSRSDPEPLVLQLAGVRGNRALADAMRLTIEYGVANDPVTTGACDGFESSGTLASGPVSRLVEDHGDPSGALRAADPRPGVSSTWYRVTVNLPLDAPEQVQGTRLTGLALTWETQATQLPTRWTDRSIRLATSVAEHSILPLLLMGVVAVLFLAIQDRIDRRDPKLAKAPSVARELDFRSRGS